MTHRPFEDWILSDRSLPAQARELLQVHLIECRQCAALARNWGRVRAVFLDTPPVAPAPGFLLRWQERLQAGS